MKNHSKAAKNVHRNGEFYVSEITFADDFVLYCHYKLYSTNPDVSLPALCPKQPEKE